MTTRVCAVLKSVKTNETSGKTKLVFDPVEKDDVPADWACAMTKIEVEVDDEIDDRFEVGTEYTIDFNEVK